MNEKLIILLQQGKYKEIESKLAKRKRNSQESVIYAVSLSSQGMSDAAEKEYLALLTADPKNFDALNNLGNVYLKREDYQAALKYFKLAADEGHSDARHLARALVNISVAAREIGDPVKELNALENAVEVAPQMSLALRALAVRYLAEKRCEEAIGLLVRAVSAEPRDVEAWANLSAGYTRNKKYEKAVEAAEEALKIRPDYAIAKANLGIALNSLERFEEAKSWLLQAHEANLQYYNVYQALAQVSLNLEVEYEEARIWCETGLKLAPNEASLLRTMGDIIARQDRRASLSWFEKALEYDPEDVLSHWNASLNYLALGEFNRGWKEYEWGFKQEKQGRGVELQFGCPRWCGESLKGKSLVIWGEQGVGDIVMFAHAIKEIAVQANVACLLIPKRLLSIFERSIPQIKALPYEAYEVITKENKRFDFHCPIASTLQWTRNRREDFIDKVPYLKPETDKVEAIRKSYLKLAGNRPIIGIAWKAGHYSLAKKKKTIDLEMLIPVIKNKDAYYVSLQYGDVEDELNRFATDCGIHIYYDKTVDGIADIDTWFAQICACDMVVSVATAGVHFAGAAGHRAKVLVPRGGNFNWQEADTKSLWYPQVEIYRQTKRGNWDDPIAKLATDVEVFVTAWNSTVTSPQSTSKEVLPEMVDLKVRSKKPNVICIVPARSGSKGLPKKNIRTVGGHPLIAWPIAAARACPLIDRIILATDDEEMAKTGRAYGAETPFIRSADVSGDLTTTEETLRYSLLESERIFGETFDIAVFLTGTDFFRLPGWVEQAVSALIEDPLLESAFVANRTHKNFWEKQPKEEDGDWGRLRDWMKVYSNRQVRVPVFREDTGLACASRAQLWRDGRRIGDRVKIIEADLTQSSLDIHDEFDLFLVEQALTWLARHRPEQLPPLPVLVATGDNA